MDKFGVITKDTPTVDDVPKGVKKATVEELEDSISKRLSDIVEKKATNSLKSA